MARLGEIQLRSGEKNLDQVMNYLYQLEEQIRYALNNLDGDNIQAGAISTDQLSEGVNGRLTTLEQTAERMSEKGTDRLTNETMKIDSSGIHWKGGGFSVNKQGEMKAQSMALPDGYAAIRTEESLPFRLHIGAEKPEGGGMLWIKPGQEENGVQPCQVYYIKEKTEE